VPNPSRCEGFGFRLSTFKTSARHFFFFPLHSLVFLFSGRSALLGRRAGQRANLVLLDATF
jgi:hypothetical protein